MAMCQDIMAMAGNMGRFVKKSPSAPQNDQLKVRCEVSARALQVHMTKAEFSCVTKKRQVGTWVLM